MPGPFGLDVPTGGAFAPRLPRRIPEESLRRYLAGERAQGPARAMSPADKTRIMSEMLGGGGGDAGMVLSGRLGARGGSRAPRTPDYVIANRRNARRVRGVMRGRGQQRRREHLTTLTTRAGRASRLQRTPLPPRHALPAGRSAAPLERDRTRGRRIGRR